MKQHGIGVGYKFPHDFEGHDVAQQYLPDKLHEAGRRYYVPTEQGVERQIGERMEAREAARTAGPPKPRKPSGPAVDSMRIAGPGHAHPRGSAQDAGRDPEEGRRLAGRGEPPMGFYLFILVVVILVVGFVGWLIWWLVDRDRPDRGDRG